MRRLRLASTVFLLAAVAALVAAGLANWTALEGLRAEAAGFEWRVRPGFLTLALFLATAALLLTGALWTWLYRGAGGRVGTLEGVAAWLGSNLGRYLPGKIWQLTGLAAYVRGRGGSPAAALATSLAGQAIVLGVGLAFGLGLAGLGPSGALRGWRLAALAALLVALAHPVVVRWLTRTGARLLREAEVPAVRLGLGRIAGAVLIAVGVWSLHGLGLWGLARGLAGPLPFGPAEAAGVFAASYVAGYLVLIAPGGLVVREGAMTALMAAAGLPVGVAAVLAVAARLWLTAAELLAFAAVAVPAARTSASFKG